MAAFVADADMVLLINNAGMVTPVGALPAQPALAVGQAVALNVGAPLMLAAALAALLEARATGLRILHVSSGAARTAYAGWSVYGATKAALDQHARAVALDGAPGIRICSLAPGVIDTAMQAQIRATPVSDFPGRARFIALHRDGLLSTPATVATRIVDYLLAPGFGSETVADLRHG